MVPGHSNSIYQKLENSSNLLDGLSDQVAIIN